MTKIEFTRYDVKNYINDKVGLSYKASGIPNKDAFVRGLVSDFYTDKVLSLIEWYDKTAAQCFILDDMQNFARYYLSAKILKDTFNHFYKVEA